MRNHKNERYDELRVHDGTMPEVSVTEMGRSGIAAVQGYAGIAE